MESRPVTLRPMPSHRGAGVCERSNGLGWRALGHAGLPHDPGRRTGACTAHAARTVSPHSAAARVRGPRGIQRPSGHAGRPLLDAARVAGTGRGARRFRISTRRRGGGRAGVSDCAADDIFRHGRKRTSLGDERRARAIHRDSRFCHVRRGGSGRRDRPTREGSTVAHVRTHLRLSVGSGVRSCESQNCDAASSKVP